MIADVLLFLVTVVFILVIVYGLEDIYYTYTRNERYARNYVSSNWDHYLNRAQIPQYTTSDLLRASYL